MIVVLLPTLSGRCRITTGLLYNMYGIRVPDNGKKHYREIKLKMGFVLFIVVITIKYTCNS